MSAGMHIDWDVPIEMDDGVVLRADVYRPAGDTPCPVILSYGPYGKWLHFEDAYPHQWNMIREERPEVLRGSTNAYQNWEVVDPERWVPDGYACVRVDSRGAGRSPGRLEIFSPRETSDLYEAIEWAAAQPWSTGKVGLNGISYYAMNQWVVASRQPPHLAAMCVWEGAADLYREMSYHGGIRSAFADGWFRTRVIPRQHGLGRRGYRSRVTGEPVSGPETLPDEALAANRANFSADVAAHPLIDEYWAARTPDYSKIRVPLLSAGNWGGQGLHLRGNVEGFTRAASEQKWLELHGLQHWTHFYTDYGVALQKRFFGHFLRGEDTGWDDQPPVLLQVRHADGRFVERHEHEWPLARTAWTKYYLEPAGLGLTTSAPAVTEQRTYDPFGDGLTFLTEPLPDDLEITGPSAAKLFLSSASEDADVFLVLRVLTPDLREVTFHGSNDPHTPMAHGWLRASHRKLDPELSLPHRPFHTHDERQPLKPGEVYEVDVEIWPTSIVVPSGYRIGLSVRGRDYVWPGHESQPLPPEHRASAPRHGGTGVGPFRHIDVVNRPADVFGQPVTLHWSSEHQPYLLLPVIPDLE